LRQTPGVMGPCVRRDDGCKLPFSNSKHSFAISRRNRPEVCQKIPYPLDQRAQGIPGAGAPAAARVVVVSTRVSHHEYTGITRHSPRNGFNGFLRALPGDRACLPPSLAFRFRQLDTSVGASGPHDFAVRIGIARLARRRVHRIPPRLCDVASRPSEWDRMAGDIDLSRVRREAEYFCGGDWTGKSLICPSGKSNSSSGTRSDDGLSVSRNPSPSERP